MIKFENSIMSEDANQIDQYFLITNYESTILQLTILFRHFGPPVSTLPKFENTSD